MITDGGGAVLQHPADRCPEVFAAFHGPHGEGPVLGGLEERERLAGGVQRGGHRNICYLTFSGPDFEFCLVLCIQKVSLYGSKKSGTMHRSVNLGTP